MSGEAYLDVAYALRIDEASTHDRELLMALATREHDEDVAEKAERLVTEGSVAVFERALAEADLGPEPETPEEPDSEALEATILSMQAFVRQANARTVRPSP